MDHDDHGLILPPPDRRELVETMSSSGMPITDVLLDGFEPKSNHPSGGFFGPRAVAENYRALLEAHPPYVDPMSSILGGYCVNFNSYREVGWNPDLDYAHLREAQEKYQLVTGIGATQHFCQDLEIGLEIGFGGLLDKIENYRQENPERVDFYDALEDIVRGIQAWIRTNVEAARERAEDEENPQLRDNLLDMADFNEKLITEPPETFQEACQWITWFDMAARMYNGSGSLGRLDVLLQPFYERDIEEGILTNEEAVFHLACMLLLDTAYFSVGGYDAEGDDVTSEVSYLILEATHRLKCPVNVGVCVGEGIDSGLLRRGVEIQFDDKKGQPKFLGVDNLVEGFARNGYSLELARERAYAGCHWFALPGREYALNDCIKINFGAMFQVAWEEMFADESVEPSVDELWERFEKHLRRAVEVIAEGLDFHTEHMHEVFPELVLDLLCHGTIERGLDASHGGVDYVNFGVDGAALATVADSFAALEQRIEKEGLMTWDEIRTHIDSDWEGPEGERARLMMRNTDRYGSGGSLGDEYAERVVQTFSDAVKAKPTPAGYNMIPGIFSWANTIPMGENLMATPNGRHAGEPISHGANPDPGFREDGAPTAMAVAIAMVQPGWGNPAPMQIELDPQLSRDEGGLEIVMNLAQTHMNLGGTEINMNVMDAEKVLEANEDPEKYPDLIVRVTGFSAYFASLSDEYRQLVVDRILAEG
ncbi:MAG: pyruvate formate lyase family protein [Anaerolineales bacterium]